LQETPLPNLQTNGVQQTNTRDALLLSLLSSEAMVDSRGYEILSAEEVEELKKVRATIQSVNIELHSQLMDAPYGDHLILCDPITHPLQKAT